MLAGVYIKEKLGMSQLNICTEVHFILTHSISEVFETPQIFNFRPDS